MADGIQTGWRTIFDLSFPQLNSVNDGIPTQLGSLSYEDLEAAIQLVAKHGKHCKMLKRDLKSAFRHIPIAPKDYWLMILQWDNRYFVDLCLPFGLRTAPHIFNLFAEALHWALETTHNWSVSHYLDDFLCIFPPDTDLIEQSKAFDAALQQMGFQKAPDKDAAGTCVMHLGFLIDSDAMEVRLPRNKVTRARAMIKEILASKSITANRSEAILGFLSHCCQAIPLGRPFLRSVYSLYRVTRKRHRFVRTRIPSKAKKDLLWWNTLLGRWSSRSIAPRDRTTFEAWTDASGKKGIGGHFRDLVFSTRVPARHRKRHINWKEMYAVLHAFILWHEHWEHGRLVLHCDNEAVVEGINKKSIRGPAIRPLQRILLIAAAFDIELIAYWIPTAENKIADALSRFDYKRLNELGLTIQGSFQTHQKTTTKASILRRKLHSFFTTPSPHLHDETTNQALIPTSHSSPPPPRPPSLHL